MNANKWLIPILALGVSTALAAPFESGSDGSDGTLQVLAGETIVLDLPADGIFNYTTVNIEATGLLQFNRNALNTPVYILATGDITIAGTVRLNGLAGTLTAGGHGGPGGFDGGPPSSPGFGAGAGQGPGAGQPGSVSGSQQAGVGGHGTADGLANDGGTYGSQFLLPLIGGSGGGGSSGNNGGGGGGGAILFASSTSIELTSGALVEARGASGVNTVVGGGSGGSIRFVAHVVSGAGQVNVNGSQGSSNAGRVRIDTLDNSGINFNFVPSNTTSVGSFMISIPDNLPQLDIVEVAGQAIAEGAPDPISILLPFGSPTMRTVRVQGRDFTGMVPISVVLTPESGDSIVVDSTIDMTSGNPATVDVSVDFPSNTVTHVHAWTR